MSLAAYPSGPILRNPFAMAKKRRKNRPTFIREWRKARGLTQGQLGDALGLTQATIARIEAGEIAYTQPVLEAAAEALRCTPADLITRPPSQPEAIWDIWDQIPSGERQHATKVLETFIKKAG